MISGTAQAMLAGAVPRRRRALLSYAVRKLCQSQTLPRIKSDDIDRIVQLETLPGPSEQADNLLLWLGNAAASPDSVVTPSNEELQAIIGAESVAGVRYVLTHLLDEGFVEANTTNPTDVFAAMAIQMKFKGWTRFQELKNASVQSMTAFMAMKFGVRELDALVSDVIRGAVADTGFELRVLTDVPRAGLIDDRLRVEIRRARFLIADLTHSNNGAYWEAGFAEGLGKPVIYICNHDAFVEQGTHFDTNHHLTVMWGVSRPDFAEDLKATIRATLPLEAKMEG